MNNNHNHNLYDPTTWSFHHFLLWWAIHLIALEIFQHGIVMQFGIFTNNRIKIAGKHLDTLEFKDKALIAFNRCCVPFLTMGMMYFCYINPNHHVEWDMNKITLWNTIGSLVGFFIFYDFWYVLFHRFLHLKAIYPWIHKHHHRQHAPTRGNLDAVNVHPFEFFTGEMLHLVCIMVIPCHIITVLVFVALSGIAASLNHTRFDITLLNGIYSVKAHDIHHRLITWNYAQYISLWDQLMGSYRPYRSGGSGEVEDVKDD
jgi:sterol desaturase/sphingolipid hydroxylase (fatty acid hydroxylase superfamily)